MSDENSPTNDPQPSAHGASPTHDAPAAHDPPKRQRMKPGERRQQILQTLAQMLEQPGGERVTTALLAARIGVSEAALYRHFASKAQMFEGLIDFIEESIFTLVNQIAEREGDGATKAVRMTTVLLQFGAKNPGMTRVMVGDALVYENERLQQRMNQFFDRFESALKQVLRVDAQQRQSATPTVDAQVRAAALVGFAMGSLQRHVRSGFKRSPLEHMEAALALMA
jgi:TetR/AcrR family transcriptional regulator